MLIRSGYLYCRNKIYYLFGVSTTEALLHMSHSSSLIFFVCIQMAEVGKKVAYGKGMVSPEAFGDKIASDVY